MKNIKLTDLISVEALQQLQDGFSRYTGMAALTTDSNGIPVTHGSGFSHFCMDLTRRSKIGCHNCEECDKNGALLTLKNGHATVYDCHAGLTDFAAPIMVEGRFIGSFIGGQIRTEPVNVEEMRKRAVKYGIDPEEYVSAAKATPCLPKEDVMKAACFLEEIAVALSGMAYRNFLALRDSMRMEKAAKSQANYVMSMSMNLEKAMSGWGKIVENAKSELSDKNMIEMLTTLQHDGHEMRMNIKDTIDYIRASESKVEILETDYLLTDLAEQIRDSISLKDIKDNTEFIVTVSEDAQKNLFGDAGRIGQLINRIVRSVLENKHNGVLEVNFSTHDFSYSTLLDIKIIDGGSGYTDEEIKVINDLFKKRKESISVDDAVIYPLEGALMKKMGGKYFYDIKNGAVTIQISIPQLALRGGN